MFCVALASLALSQGAQARPDPAPKPSGVVVHLFGPDSVATHFLPTPPAHAGHGTADTGPSPGYGAILHQMFVTGDPSQAPGAAIAKGRTAERQGK
jgi:hypothetical protein